VKHAKLSASGSHQWIACPGSISAQENYPKKESVYSQEGTYAHEFAAFCLTQNVSPLNYVNKLFQNQIITEEIAKNVNDYVDYIYEHVSTKSLLFVEKRVNFSKYVPGGFGTLDCAIVNVNNQTCEIFDFKYGRGVKVNAINNSQALLYALGMTKELENIIKIEKFRLHIVQPRLDHISTWQVSNDFLKKFSVFIKEKADIALSKNAPRVPGEKQCKFCRAKADCKELYEFTKNILVNEFDDLEKNTLSDQQKKLILDNKDLIESFLKAIKDDVFFKLYNGDSFEGYKLVEGRSLRRWKDESENILKEKYGERAYERKLIGITKAKSFLSKEEIKELTIKPTGNPTLVKSSDERKELKFDIKNDFDDLT